MKIFVRSTAYYRHVVLLQAVQTLKYDEIWWNMNYSADFEMQVVDGDFARCFAPSGVGQSLHLLVPKMQVRMRARTIAAPRGRAANICVNRTWKTNCHAQTCWTFRYSVGRSLKPDLFHSMLHSIMVCDQCAWLFRYAAAVQYRVNRIQRCQVLFLCSYLLDGEKWDSPILVKRN